MIFNSLFCAFICKKRAFTHMGQFSHFSKPYYENCNRDGEYLQSIYSSNREAIQTVIREFNRVLSCRAESEETAIKAIKASGGLTSRTTLFKFRNGEYFTASTTFLNILSRYAGYKDFIDLAFHVRARELGYNV